MNANKLRCHSYLSWAKLYIFLPGLNLQMCLLSVCVCVCVWHRPERERERASRGRTDLIGGSARKRDFTNLSKVSVIMVHWSRVHLTTSECGLSDHLWSDHSRLMWIPGLNSFYDFTMWSACDSHFFFFFFFTYNHHRVKYKDTEKRNTRWESV